MRILTVTHYFGGHGGGIERVAERLVAELARLGHELTWLASDATPPRVEAPVRAEAARCWHWAERRLGLPFPVPRPGEFGRIARAVEAADAVLLHDCLYPANIAAFLLAKRAAKPVVVVQHIGDVPYRNPVLRLLMQAANRLITRTLLAQADGTVFISELTARHFAQVPSRRAPVLAFNGVDSELFNRTAKGDTRGCLRARLGVAEQSKVVVFAGRFVEKKGLPVVRGLAELRPDLAFVLAGKGPVAPEDWGLGNVHVLGQQSGEQLAELYRGGDLLLLPSTGEGFPLVIQEALACGLPVLCGEETAGADAEAQPYLAAAAIDSRSTEQTVRNFLPVLDRELAAAATSDQAAERSRFAIDRYSWQAAGRIYHDLLIELAGNGGRGQAHVPGRDTAVTGHHFLIAE